MSQTPAGWFRDEVLEADEMNLEQEVAHRSQEEPEEKEGDTVLVHDEMAFELVLKIPLEVGSYLYQKFYGPSSHELRATAAFLATKSSNDELTVVLYTPYGRYRWA